MTDRTSVGRRANVGAINTGPGQMIVGTAVGQQNNPAQPSSQPAGHQTAPVPSRADIGILTILSLEMRAVVDTLRRNASYRTRPLRDGTQAHEAEVPVADGTLRTVAIQALDRGPRSAAAAYHRLHQHYAPPIVLLVGIAGAINPRLAVGDVVIADEVIYYDARRETPEGVRRRGQAQPMAAVLGHRLNEFFRVHGDVLRDRRGRSFQVVRGPIGSGDAVIADQASDIRDWLGRFHEKTLAVETEAGGIAQAFYEEVGHAGAQRGWLTIRGISDLADPTNRYQHHDLAAGRAAEVLERLLPFLVLTGANQEGW
jgi:adenosylhomocysteine nucleosidase